MLIIDFLQSIALALAIMIIAFVYKEFLLREVLHFWAKIGDRYEKRWFYKPIWGCYRCIAGQMALWAYILTRLTFNHTAEIGPPGRDLSVYVCLPVFGHYSFIGHLTAICGAILFTDLLTYFYDKK